MSKYNKKNKTKITKISLKIRLYASYRFYTAKWIQTTHLSLTKLLLSSKSGFSNISKVN